MLRPPDVGLFSSSAPILWADDLEDVAYSGARKWRTQASPTVQAGVSTITMIPNAIILS
jgi:hypothetical protein